MLTHESKNLQSNLAQKERAIYGFLSDKKELNNARQFHKNAELGLAFIAKYRDQGINILTYEDDELVFWSSIKAVPLHPELIKEGSTFQPFSNGWYEVIKKTLDNETIIFLIQIETHYPIHNKYLKNGISDYLIDNNSLMRASFSDYEVYPIVNLNGKVLFEVKLKQQYSKSIYASIEIWLWVIGLFSFCLFFNSFCSWLAKRGNLIPATILITLFFLIIRLTDLQYGWFMQQFELSIFNPKVYGESEYLPTLGDFLLNVVAITWVVLFIFTYADKYTIPNWLSKSKTGGLIFQFSLLIIFGLLAFLFNKIFLGLIENSKIDFDITNIINLGWISWVSIVILCLVWFNIYIIASVFMQLSLQLNVTNRERLLLFFSVFLIYFLYRLEAGFTISFVLYAFFIYIIGWNFYVKENKFSVSVFAALFFCLASITSLKYQQFIDDKEKDNRVSISQKLVAPDDISVISTIENLESGILSNSFVLNYFKQPALS
ncbi:MAG: two-component sensor histidine kinase, partial [Flavobacterium sp.]